MIQMQGLEDLRAPPVGTPLARPKYMGLRQAKGVERTNEAMMKITASIETNTKSVDTLITAIGRKG